MHLLAFGRIRVIVNAVYVVMTFAAYRYLAMTRSPGRLGRYTCTILPLHSAPASFLNAMPVLSNAGYRSPHDRCSAYSAMACQLS